MGLLDMFYAYVGVMVETGSDFIRVVMVLLNLGYRELAGRFKRCMCFRLQGWFMRTVVNLSVVDRVNYGITHLRNTHSATHQNPRYVSFSRPNPPESSLNVLLI